MKTYQATLKHDNGTHRMTVKAETIEQAMSLVCKAENCPPGAVQLRCKILESDPETVYLEWFNDWITCKAMAEYYKVPTSELIKVIEKGKEVNRGMGNRMTTTEGTPKAVKHPTPEQYRDTLKAQGYGPTIGNHGLIFVHPPGGYKRSFISYEEAVKHYRL